MEVGRIGGADKERLRERMAARSSVQAPGVRVRRLV